MTVQNNNANSKTASKPKSQMILMIKWTYPGLVFCVARTGHQRPHSWYKINSERRRRILPACDKYWKGNEKILQSKTSLITDLCSSSLCLENIVPSISLLPRVSLLSRGERGRPWERGSVSKWILGMNVFQPNALNTLKLRFRSNDIETWTQYSRIRQYEIFHSKFSMHLDLSRFHKFCFLNLQFYGLWKL